ncbi:hypothetical protein [Streptomyces canus]|uniref:hypothetical protein n=1 Tax=Streptomyces canus TaxID=58343 RepID=UPI002E2C4139|nr:hypothetical protein [Streptomyces canus]
MLLTLRNTPYGGATAPPYGPLTATPWKDTAIPGGHVAHHDPSTRGQDRPAAAVHRQALDAATQAVEQSAQLEQAWLTGPARTATASTEGPADLIRDLRNLDQLMSAPGYKVLRSRPKAPTADGAWSTGEPLTLNRARVRRLVEAWVGPMDALPLRAPDDRLYIVTARVQTELIPTTIEPPHTEGDVLGAALHAYGLPAYEDGESGVTWLAVPQNSATTERDVYKGPHFRISCGEHADRVASAHDGAWEDSAHCARAVADRITDWPFVQDPRRGRRASCPAPARSALGSHSQASRVSAGQRVSSPHPKTHYYFI